VVGAAGEIGRYEDFWFWDFGLKEAQMNFEGER